MDLLLPSRSYQRRLAAFLAASFVAMSVIVIKHQGPYGDLANMFTDHLHHAHATWALFKRGFDIYRLPFGIVAPEVNYPQPAATWPEFPVPYPPGFAGVFLIPTLIGRFWPMSMPAFGKVSIVYLLAITHLALYAMGMAIKDAGGARPVLMFLFWLLCVRSASLGFYDPAWIGCGAMSSIAFARKRGATSLAWFTAAAFMNLRAVSMLPMGIVAAWWVARGPHTWVRKALLIGGAGVLGILSCYSFLLFMKNAPPANSHIYIAATKPYSFEPEIVRTSLLWMAAVGFSYVAVRAGNWLVVLTTLCTTFFTLQHGAHAWHSSMLIAPVLVTHQVADSKTTPMLYGAAAVWCLIVFQLGFAHEPTLFLEEIVNAVRGLP